MPRAATIAAGEMAVRKACALTSRRAAMPHDRKPSTVARRKSASQHLPAQSSSVAQGVLGVLIVAAIAVLSLPQARAVSASFGWVPFWLVALPASAWLALQAQRLTTPAPRVPAAVSPRRRSAAPVPRRRIGSGVRVTRTASAA
jgi:hypothetical protein